MKDLLQSRKFWTLVVALVILLVGVYVSQVEAINQGAVVSLVIVLVSYILGVAVDPGTGWRGVLQSRKFWAALIGLVVIILSAFDVVLPIPPDNLIAIAVIFGGYIAGVAVEDKFG